MVSVALSIWLTVLDLLSNLNVSFCFLAYALTRESFSLLMYHAIVALSTLESECQHASNGHKPSQRSSRGHCKGSTATALTASGYTSATVDNVVVNSSTLWTTQSPSLTGLFNLVTSHLVIAVAKVISEILGTGIRTTHHILGKA